MDFTVKINLDSIEQFKQIYGENLINKIYSITTDYNQRIIRDAKEILRAEDKIDTGRLRNSIKQSVKVYSTGFVNSIYSGTKYARFVHEGAEHKDSKIVPHFVSFKTAPSLFVWAKKHKIIQKIQGDWYFIDKYNGEHLIKNINESGLRVYSYPTKFLEKPFLVYKDKYIEEIERLFDKL